MKGSTQVEYIGVGKDPNTQANPLHVISVSTWSQLNDLSFEPDRVLQGFELVLPGGKWDLTEEDKLNNYLQLVTGVDEYGLGGNGQLTTTN
ncbi:hypothetical protein Taro_027985 [Colocasia esculenta]|uniref:Uncharacterized protein n=1 Tax=Colocasia esculenta TaxID=4460 RepID=A0A843VA41_COLES|nr:hypothetical protein [Colocasia esculenta]